MRVSLMKVLLVDFRSPTMEVSVEHAMFTTAGSGTHQIKVFTHTVHSSLRPIETSWSGRYAALPGAGQQDHEARVAVLHLAV